MAPPRPPPRTTPSRALPAASTALTSHSPDETRRIGALLGDLLEPGDVVLLEGNLGAGKTVFAQGVAAGLGVEAPVTSPTFTLIHEHSGRLMFYHVDLYRIEGDAEAVDLGLEDYFYGGGVTLVEWSGRAPGVLPAEHLAIQLQPRGESERAIRLVASGRRYVALLAAFERRITGT
ncbi:MAG: tRNA (adenosine(37)-N6)-threonylcarbamoyltransferase complex ATPase subunit type 1 TsaE [Chloroflexi bacterium]|nr:tRNA (adenosine(37)-N6)-threonylcarbamoyltransferase complex ATPase subunit type 1 TsaE [Chloroflexota bacterium]